jgi:diaminohydroxyphosphoribosylaminopyrimidine deaminase/5-amino-6-(5-phosphoribosylamino)uracil reductase
VSRGLRSQEQNDINVGTKSDEQLMRQALRLAGRGRGRTSPNPMVGAVVVADRRIVGEGWHRGPGTPHAEALALAAAGDLARSATVYTNLEPCTHFGRMPPCVDALIASGVHRVVAATADPDPRVSGRGIEKLRSAGVDVQLGLLEEAAKKLNAAYLMHRQQARPFVTYKAAISLDGRTAAADGTSRWITGPEARRDVHRERARSDAICVGVGTLLADDPSLTVRHLLGERRPFRVVVDSTARTPPQARLLSPEAPTLVAVSEDAPEGRTSRLEEAGAEIVRFPSDGGKVSLKHLLEHLAQRDVVSLLLEGGATLAEAFVAQGFVDRYLFYVAPKLIGDTRSGVLVGWRAQTLREAATLRIESVKRIGPDLRVEAYPEREAT